MNSPARPGPFRTSEVPLADPYPHYQRYREADPVHRAEDAWYLFRHRDVARVLTGRDFGRGTLPAPIPRQCPHLLRTVRNWMVFMDPPRHTAVRALAARAFTPRTVETLRPRIHRIVTALADELATRQRADLVADFAAPLPILVISELLGVPASDRPWFRARAVDLQQATSSRAGRRPDALAVAEAAARELDGYFRAQLARRGPGEEDLIAAMLAAAAGGPLDEDVLTGTCIHLLTAGHETTTNLLCKGMLALLAHPFQLRLLRDRPELLPDAVEELIRYDSPVQMISRWAHTDADLGGRTVARGEKVVLVLGSANRDPARFPDPERLDIRRDARRHCGFGLGAHYCLGAPLARVEAEAGLRSLLHGLPGLALCPDDPVRYAQDLVFHGPERMPVRTGAHPATGTHPAITHHLRR
ncbi:cytochrome P450 [Streptomyces sp. NPDC052396]|uniref:cytochrome P450 n=1 Tax=Streptomyces sp. NPDC052396 TaxID=3365689 RepID=UPI0037CF0DA3